MLARLSVLSLLGIVLVSGGKHEGGGHHDGGKKHGSYGVGYVEEGGVVGYSCHEGFIPQGEGPNMTCIHKEKFGLIPSCNIGMFEGDHCLLREPAIFSCPPGFVQVGNYNDGGKKHGGGHHGGHGGKKHGGGPLCMKIDRIPYESYCSPGTSMQNGQCMRMEIAPATMICPLEQGGGKKHGHGGHGGHGGKKHSYIQPPCVESMEVAPILTCPPNLELHGNSCIGVGQGPCPQPMPAPLILDQGKKHKHHRSLGEEEESDEETIEETIVLGEDDDETISKELSPLALGDEDIESNEDKIDSNGPLTEESSRLLQDSDDNISDTIITNVVGRELGEKKDKHGYHDYGVPVLAPVPSKVKMCNLEIIEPAIPLCPPGSIESGGYDHHKKSHHGNNYGGLQCIQTVDIPLEPYCPMGGAMLRLDTMTCESRVFDQGLTRCPLGFEPCDYSSHKKEKKHKKDKHGSGLFEDAGCCAVQYADPIPGCPMNAMLVGGQCLIKHSPIFECPPGAIRDGEFCYVIQTKPPKIHYQINVTTKQAVQPFVETGKKHKKHH